jgi:hypothetical protein
MKITVDTIIYIANLILFLIVALLAFWLAWKIKMLSIKDPCKLCEMLYDKTCIGIKV